MPPVRIKERGRAKKDTLPRLIKMLKNIRYDYLLPDYALRLTFLPIYAHRFSLV